MINGLSARVGAAAIAARHFRAKSKARVRGSGRNGKQKNAMRETHDADTVTVLLQHE
jgi:hypothetical protein